MTAPRPTQRATPWVAFFLLPAVRGLALLEEGGEALAHVGRRRDDPEEVALDSLAFLLRYGAASQHGLECQRDRQRAVREDLRRDRADLRLELGGLEHVVHEPERLRRRSVEAAAGEDHLERAAAADDPRQP